MPQINHPWRGGHPACTGGSADLFCAESCDLCAGGSRRLRGEASEAADDHSEPEPLVLRRRLLQDAATSAAAAAASSSTSGNML